MSKAQELIEAKNEVLQKLTSQKNELDAAKLKITELEAEINAAKQTALTPPVDMTPDADVANVVTDLKAAAAS